MANTFNPQADLPRDQNFLGYSKGFRDNSMGEFANNVAQGLNVGLQALDRGVDQMANDEVRQVVADADAQLLGIQNQPTKDDPLEGEIKRQIGNLRNKKIAMDKGTIDPDHYYATVMAKVKDIRARYSGYNEQIDQHLQAVGIDPNWQRKEILAEGARAAAANRAAANEFDKNNRELVESVMKNPKTLISPEDQARWANDPFAHRDPKFMQRIKSAVVTTNSVYAINDALKLDAEMTANEDKTKGIKIGKAYTQDLLTILHTGLRKSGAMNIFMKLNDQAQQERTETGMVDPDTQTKLTAAFASVRQEAMAARMAIKANPLYIDGATLATTEMANADKMYDDYFDNLDKALTDKNWSALAANTNRIKFLVEGKQAGILNASDLMRTHDAMRGIIGEQAYSMYVGHNLDKASSEFDPFYKDAVLADQLNGTVKSFVEAITKTKELGMDKPEQIQKAFTGTVDLILAPETKQDGALKLARSMFNPANQAFWDAVIADPNLKPADKRAYYKVLTSPKMHEKINELAGLDPDIKRGFYQYVNYMSQHLNQQSITDINDTIVYSSNSTVRYNQTTRQLEIVPTESNIGNGTRNAVSNVWESIKGSSADEAVKNMNATITALTPIFEAQGLKADEAIPMFLKRSGIDFDAKKQGNLIERGGRVLDDFFIRDPKAAMSKLGASDLAGSPDADALMAPDQPPEKTELPNFGGPGFNQAIFGNNPVEVRQGLLQDIKEMNALYNSTEDPETKAGYKKDLDSLMETYRTLRNPDGTKEKGSSAAPFAPRGNPVATLTQENQVQAKNALDILTGVPSLVDAIKSGDPREIATQMAIAGLTLIPGGAIERTAAKAIPGGLKAIEGGKAALGEAGQKAMNNMGSFADDIAQSLKDTADKLGLNFKGVADRFERGASLNEVRKDLSAIEKGGMSGFEAKTRLMTDAELTTALRELNTSTATKTNNKQFDIVTREILAREQKALALEGGNAVRSKADEAGLTVLEGGKKVNDGSKSGAKLDVIENPASIEARKIAEELDKGVTDSIEGFTKVSHEDMITERANTIVKQATPKDVGKRISQLKEFLEVVKEPVARESMMKEMEVLEKARELFRKGLKPVKK